MNYEEETTELRARVRELEAELVERTARERRALDRAEKAEEQYRIAYEQQTENVKVLEARVAELARHLDGQHDCPDHCTSAPEHLEEAREREAVYHANPAGSAPITHPASERCFLCSHEREAE